MVYLSSNSSIWFQSCETSLLQIINECNGMVMIDFRKAFNLVDHNVLLKNLNTTTYEKRLSVECLPICWVGNKKSL